MSFPIVVGLPIALVLLGRAETETPRERQAEFLKNADIIEAKVVGKGVTETWRLTLKDDTRTHDASFQYVDEREAMKTHPGGTVEVDFVDSYRYNIAGYELAELLGLAHMVPVSVERRWRGKRGALTWWVDDVLMDEATMNEKGLKAPRPKRLERTDLSCACLQRAHPRHRPQPEKPPYREGLENLGHRLQPRVPALAQNPESQLADAL